MNNNEKASDKKTILVTGANGQLGQCFRKKAHQLSAYRFIFASLQDLDITDSKNIAAFFAENKIDYCLNCAAYTKVEQAEIEMEKAFLINAEAVKDLAVICHEHHTTLFHFSTDYVFDGTAKKPYKETDKTHPINTYGASKLKGEDHIQAQMEKYFIFRTSWLYSEFGHNFYKIIAKKAQEKDVELKITTEQIGTPTNANDLAEAVIQLIQNDNKDYGLYHFSNQGEGTWYDFAKAILENNGGLKNVGLHATKHYKTMAKRPVYSVLSKDKVTAVLGLTILSWQASLKQLQAEENHEETT